MVLRPLGTQMSAVGSRTPGRTRAEYHQAGKTTPGRGGCQLLGHSWGGSGIFGVRPARWAIAAASVRLTALALPRMFATVHTVDGTQRFGRRRRRMEGVRPGACGGSSSASSRNRRTICCAPPTWWPGTSPMPRTKCKGLRCRSRSAGVGSARSAHVRRTRIMDGVAHSRGRPRSGISAGSVVSCRPSPSRLWLGRSYGQFGRRLQL